MKIAKLAPVAVLFVLGVAVIPRIHATLVDCRLGCQVTVDPSQHVWEVGSGGSEAGRLTKVTGALTPGQSYTVSATGNANVHFNSPGGYYNSVLVAGGNSALDSVQLGGTTTLTPSGPGSTDAAAFLIDHGSTGDNTGSINVVLDDGISPFSITVDGRAGATDTTNDKQVGRSQEILLDSIQDYWVSASGVAKWGTGANDIYNAVFLSHAFNAFAISPGETVYYGLGHGGNGNEAFFLDFGNVSAGQGKANNIGSIVLTFFTEHPPANVPEPSTLLLLGAGLLGFHHKARIGRRS